MADKTANRNKTEKRAAPPTAFKPGQSGNPSGRPKLPEEFKELAKTNSVTALQKVIDILNNPESDNKDRLKAAEIIMDRAWGKANQPIDGQINGGLTIKIDGNVKDWAR